MTQVMVVALTTLTLVAAVPPKVTGARTDEMLYDLLEVRIKPHN